MKSWDDVNTIADYYLSCVVGAMMWYDIVAFNYSTPYELLRF